MKIDLVYPLILVILLCSIKSGAQGKTFKVTIQFPSGIDKKEIWLGYDNGTGRKTVKVVKNTQVISDLYYSERVSIEMSYPSLNQLPPSPYFGFFVDSLPATVRFEDAQAGNPFKNHSGSNYAEFNSVGGIDLNSFIKKDVDDYNSYYAYYNLQKNAADSIITKLIEKGAAMTRAKLEFVKKHGDSYYSFWLFRTGLSGSPKLNPDTLYQVFNRVFPKKFIESFEGQEALKNIMGIALKKGSKAPLFSSMDIYGNRVDLSTLKGKYVLLDFWASWCSPCIAELPVIKNLSGTISSDKLQIISITLDTDSAAFVKSMKKHQMNWTHLYNDKEIMRSYGAYFVPTVFLIDPKGTLVYSRQEEIDYPNLKKLSALIQNIHL